MREDITDIKNSLKDAVYYWESEPDKNVTDEDVSTHLDDIADYIKNSESFKLYKYCPADYYSIRNFEMSQVWLAPNGNLNDVYEGVPRCDRDLCESNSFGGISSIALSTSFSERNNSVLMWAHYAEASKGFCIEYDLKRLTKEQIISIGLYPIIYEEKRPIYRDAKSLADAAKELEKELQNDEEYSVDEPLDDLIPLMIFKGKDWEYEKEWRMICTKKELYIQGRKTTNGISQTMNCVSGVIFGFRMEEVKKKHLLDIIQRKQQEGNDIAIYKTALSPDSYDFVIEKY